MTEVTMKIYDNNDNLIEFIVDGKKSDRLNMAEIGRIRAKIDLYENDEFNVYGVEEITRVDGSAEGRQEDHMVIIPKTINRDYGEEVFNTKYDPDQFIIFGDNKEPDFKDMIHLLTLLGEFMESADDEENFPFNDSTGNMIECLFANKDVREEREDREKIFGKEDEQKDSSTILPDHYKRNGKEAWDIINDIEEYHDGGIDTIEAGILYNVMKYLLRYPYKNSPVKDLEKAKTYIDEIIKYVEV